MNTTDQPAPAVHLALAGRRLPLLRGDEPIDIVATFIHLGASCRTEHLGRVRALALVAAHVDHNDLLYKVIARPVDGTGLCGIFIDYRNDVDTDRRTHHRGHR